MHIELKEPLPSDTSESNVIDIKTEIAVKQGSKVCQTEIANPVLHTSVAQIEQLPRNPEGGELNEKQRFVFLRVILAFGVRGSQEIFEKLLKFEAGSYQNTSKEFTRFNCYVLKFTHHLRKAIQREEDDVPGGPFFFNVQPSFIYKRICNLRSLRGALERHVDRHTTFLFCPRTYKHFSKGTAGWSAADNYLFGSLIIDRGYGRWTNIAMAKDWRRFKQERGKRSQEVMNERDEITFGAYVRSIYHLQEVEHSSVESILKERAEHILGIVY